MVGIVHRIRNGRGFGFVRGPEATEFYLHATAMAGGPEYFDALTVGDAVLFDVEHGDPRGPRAVNVRVIPVAEARALQSPRSATP
jgi:cold shock CspA family protein